MRKKILKYKCITICIINLLTFTSKPVSASDTYFSELTGKEISIDLINQRPIAVMIDNEKQALPHYGVSEADIVYEIMNSTANNRITRLMCIYKDWGNVPRIGSVRSVRTTNIPIAAEYDALLIHEGGPELYISEPLKEPWITDLNGGFSRLQNGKAKEFTEFVISGEVEEHAKANNASIEYTKYKPNRSTHFNFVEKEYQLSDKYQAARKGVYLDLSAAFKHNHSELKYNSETNTYDYYVYNELQKDEEDNETISFKNVILQVADYKELDSSGYLNYEIIDSGKGCYLTNGEFISITWEKESETEITKYQNCITKEEIKINPGKTYIALIPLEYAKHISYR